jgi:hypothetical protein
MDYSPSNEATWWEKTFPVEAGKQYWVGAWTGRTFGADFAWLSVDEGTENGVFYQQAWDAVLEQPAFGNDIGSGQTPKYTNYMTTGTATYRLGLCTNGTSKLHSEFMDKTGFNTTLEATWVCEANPTDTGMPVFPPYVSETARSNMFAPVWWTVATRPNPQDAGGAALVIRSDGSPASPYGWTQFPFIGGIANDLDDASTFTGPLGVADNNFRITGSPARRANAGKFYFEIFVPAAQPPSAASVDGINAGVCHIVSPSDSHLIGQNEFGTGTTELAGCGVLFNGTQVNQFGTASGALALTPVVAGDVVGLAVDFDNDTIDYYINNVLETEIMNEVSATPFDDDVFYVPSFSVAGNQDSAIVTGRLKLADFTYTPPTGFLPWSPE